MGLLRKSHAKHPLPRPHHKASHAAGSRSRLCRFEQMEPRQLLSATAPALNVGATYYQPHDGNDSVGSLLYISWNGGEQSTRLTDLYIDTHKVAAGDPQFTVTSPVPGDVFFHTAPSSVGGTMDGVPPQVVEWSGTVQPVVTVSNDSTLMHIQFVGQDFQSSGRLVLKVNFDIMESWSGGDAKRVVEGADFDGTSFEAVFAAPHYQTATVDGFFRNVYANPATTYGLNLPDDNYDNSSAIFTTNMPPAAPPEPVFTAGILASVQQNPLPITLSGTVFEDLNTDNHQETGEPGIGSVALTLYALDDNGDYVATGKTATTDANGDYQFTGLLPGTYRVVETQPVGYSSVGATAGTVGGATRGVVTTVDELSSINLDGGDNSVHNNFAEVRLAEISGYVYVDANNNGVYDANEVPIAGVQLTLLDANGNPTGLTATTDQSGFYRFENLTPGTYCVAEAQPAGYYDGLDTPGTAGGVAQNPGDEIDAIPLASGVNAKDYNFGELLPASISGRVYADLNNNSSLDSGEPLLADVTIYLVDGAGNQIASTTTDADGKYAFVDLKPGVYGVQEIQPANYLEGGDVVGSAGGALDGPDRILNAQLDSGVNGVNYDFWEEVPAKISGYVFQDGPAIVVKEGDPAPNIPALRNGQLTPDDKRLPGVVLQLCDGSGVPLLDSQGRQITTVTDANGYYEFDMLYSGVYSIREIAPSQYLPGVDTVGSKGGLVVNRYATIDPSVLSTLAVDTGGNAIVRIPINPGDVAVQYNFSNVLVETQPVPPPTPPPPSPPPSPEPPLPSPIALPFVEYQPVGQPYYLPPDVVIRPLFGGGGEPGGCSWHLSVIDAGNPRGEASGTEVAQYPQDSYFDPVSWTGADLGQSQWILANQEGVPIKTIRFGIPGATPVTGDWDGSGTTKVGVFLDGLWFLDLNGNGIWDRADLWIKLGKKGDQPVTGDWNGDGKTDIGIFGPAWVGDSKAVAADPGLPDSQNPPKVRPKNVPPDPAHAATGYRTLKRGSVGKLRSDLIDHVFQYGSKGDIAVTGDWNGDGIYTIGIFRDGVWFLDMDGDGRWSEGDLVVEFGQPGDLPVVGDWTGDGISKLGVYRNGTFYLDTNNNHQLDPSDKVIELGRPGDNPVAGDWEGNGVDEVGVYEDGVAPEPST